MNDIQSDLAQIVRLALNEQTDDVRLYVAKLVRKYRNTDPPLAERLTQYLRLGPHRRQSALRDAMASRVDPHPLPVDDESRLSLLKVFAPSPDRERPVLAAELEAKLRQLIEERRQAALLCELGLMPPRSAFFFGKPGVGKTLTARWLASQLNVPLYVLDLTAVMSSLLGRSGSNLRAVLDFAKQTNCVLLLDEIDAIAKRRSDDADVGELKRLVTVILQEVDEWPSTGLLLAATNHPELIDPALWRRFDLVLEFPLPEPAQVRAAIERFLGADLGVFHRWVDILTYVYTTTSFSDIARDMQRIRRALALGAAPAKELIQELAKTKQLTLNHQERIKLSLLLAEQTDLSQHAISNLTGVSRDTIRKHSKASGPDQDGGSNRKAYA